MLGVDGITRVSYFLCVEPLTPANTGSSLLSILLLSIGYDLESGVAYIYWSGQALKLE